MADAQKDTERKGFASFKASGETAGSPDEIEQLVVTINPAMGGIVKLEKIDKTGKHTAFSEEEFARFVGEDEADEIEDALDEAFEAGVAGVLGDLYETDGDAEEKAIRRVLIGEFLVPGAVRRRITRRLILSRLLRHGSLNRRSRQ
jgi:hypothetical protein